MALLQFQNLGIPNPESVMRRVVGGLRIFNQYLRRTEEFLKSDQAMLRIEWKSAKAPAGPGFTQGGSWGRANRTKGSPK
jgi:hypothetical protein